MAIHFKKEVVEGGDQWVIRQVETNGRHTAVADIRRKSSEMWSTEVNGPIWLEAGEPVQFADQPTAQEAFGTAARVGDSL